MTTYDDAKLKHYEEQKQVRRKNISKITVEFIGGTNIDKACTIMYDLHCETLSDIDAVFNNTHIRMMDNELRKILGK